MIDVPGMVAQRAGSGVASYSFAVRRLLLWHEHGEDISQKMLAQRTFPHPPERALIFVQLFHRDLLSPGRFVPERRSNYAGQAAANRATPAAQFNPAPIVASVGLAEQPRSRTLSAGASASPAGNRRLFLSAVHRDQRAMRSAIQPFSDSMLLVNPPQRIRLTPKT